MPAALTLRGVSPVIAVPFHDDGRLDLAGFERVAEHIIASGAESALLFGLASEYPKLTEAERDTLLATFVRRARGSRLGVIASVTDHSADVAVDRARANVEAGASAINIFPPFFLSPSKDQVLDHIRAVADAVEVPTVVQFAPNETSTAITCADIAGVLGSCRSIAAVKVEASPPGAAVAQLLTLAPRPVAVLCGYAGLHWPNAVANGATGVQPGCSFVELYQAAQARLDLGDSTGFSEQHKRLLPWLARWMTSVERIVAIEKAILAARGFIASPYCRRPAYKLTPADHADIAQFLSSFAGDFGQEPS